MTALACQWRCCTSITLVDNQDGIDDSDLVKINFNEAVSIMKRVSRFRMRQPHLLSYRRECSSFCPYSPYLAYLGRAKILSEGKSDFVRKKLEFSPNKNSFSFEQNLRYIRGRFFRHCGLPKIKFFSVKFFSEGMQRFSRI